ncbi:MAG TPA: hypothetical protein PK052_09910 [Anaerohalosphaeraceae bacterium]|nr:hypothetical protein [Phycisphaerae bacterium]HOK95750.1 hypothetical protein [Anaerohalosphaeraceae bacterium]HOL32283.1 hypothetical protein [Anaerohalosphaeraceae bacterium]HOM77116.1 hypothetical protein [Anaerohalosphaeraceae bacterium]HPC64300.1 hypothetical protein [Anaerohalosphaeraceae bacterium]
MHLQRIIWAILLIGASCFAQLRNGRFEIPDPNASHQYYTPPKYWDYINYAGLHSSFVPTPHPGHRDPNAVQWSIPSAYEGSNFVLLSTGDTEGPGTDLPTITAACISQAISVSPGNILMGNYLFGTTDYLPFNDTAVIILIPADSNDGVGEIPIAQMDVLQVGDYKANDGWQSFFVRFDEQTAGDYILYCEVSDDKDTTYQSYLAVDNIRLCLSSSDKGDITQDCAVNYEDFSVLSSAWLCDCQALNDPNSPLYDPNQPCSAADLDRNAVVDTNDLLPMADYWLHNFWTID